MAKISLLEMTQNILDGLGLDAVNSIDDTEDASKVARIIRNTYRNLVALREFPEHSRIGTLWASTDDQRPTHMEIPEDCIDISLLKYDIRTTAETRQRFVKIPYIDPEEFMLKVHSRDDTNSNVQVVLDYDKDRKLFIENDKRPEFWTSFDDEHIVFDSFDSAVDDTIQQSKTIVTMIMEPSFTLKDDFIPDLHAKSFPMLENEAAKAASIKVAQAVDEDAERTGRRLFIKNAWDKHKVAGGIKYPNYGRGR
jgi:hypothetical protein